MANRDEIPRTTPAEIENLIQQVRAANLEPAQKKDDPGSEQKDASKASAEADASQEQNSEKPNRK